MKYREFRVPRSALKIDKLGTFISYVERNALSGAMLSERDPLPRFQSNTVKFQTAY